MFRKSAFAAIGVALLGLGLTTGTPSSAFAGNSGYGVTIHGEHGRLHIGSGNIVKRRMYHRDRTCQPRDAITKARYAYGVRHAHIERISHSFVIVEGRMDWRKVKIGFKRSSGDCRVAWIDRDRRHSDRLRHHRWDGRRY